MCSLAHSWVGCVFWRALQKNGSACNRRAALSCSYSHTQWHVNFGPLSSVLHENKHLLYWTSVLGKCQSIGCYQHATLVLFVLHFFSRSRSPLVYNDMDSPRWQTHTLHPHRHEPFGADCAYKWQNSRLQSNWLTLILVLIIKVLIFITLLGYKFRGGTGTWIWNWWGSWHQIEGDFRILREFI